MASFRREFDLPDAQLAGSIVSLRGLPGPDTLALGRANWKVGAVALNLVQKTYS